MKRVLYVAIHLLMLAGLLMIALSAAGLVQGSAEQIATPEQQEKARLAYAALLTGSAVAEAALLGVRRLLRKQMPCVQAGDRENAAGKKQKEETEL